MNSFEKNVINSVEPQVPVIPAASTKKPVKKSKIKAYALIFFSITLIFALILIARGVFLQSPPAFDNNGITDVNSILDPNNPANLKALNIGSSSALAISITDNITSSFTPDYNDKFWLFSNTLINTKVGFVDKIGYKERYILPVNTSMVKIFNDESIIFATSPKDNRNAELYLKSPNDLPILINTLEPNQFYVSIFFSNSEKLFYYSYFDNTETYVIEAVDLTGKKFTILKSNFLKQDYKIINVTNSDVSLEGDKDCYKLILKGKTLNLTACENLKSNDLDVIYWSNSGKQSLYSTLLKGELYKSNSQSPDRKLLASANPGQIFTKLQFHKDSLYYVFNDLVQTASNTWQSTPRNISKFNIESGETSLLQTELPLEAVQAIIPFDKDIYVIVQKTSGATKLLKYTAPTPVTVLTNPVSSPVSFPGSFPISSPGPKTNWLEVNLGDITSVRLLNSRFTL